MKRIIKCMQNIRRMRLLVQVVDKLNKARDNDDIMRGLVGAYKGIARSECIDAFNEKYPKYSKYANEICDSAIAHCYIKTNDPDMIPMEEKRLMIDPHKGRILLSHSGYLNELASSIGKLTPILTWLIALISLGVSITVAVTR